MKGFCAEILRLNRQHMRYHQRSGTTENVWSLNGGGRVPSRVQDIIHSYVHAVSRNVFYVEIHWGVGDLRTR